MWSLWLLAKWRGNDADRTRNGFHKDKESIVQSLLDHFHCIIANRRVTRNLKIDWQPLHQSWIQMEDSLSHPLRWSRSMLFIQEIAFRCVGLLKRQIFFKPIPWWVFYDTVKYSICEIVAVSHDSWKIYWRQCWKKIGISFSAREIDCLGIRIIDGVNFRQTKNNELMNMSQHAVEWITIQSYG